MTMILGAWFSLQEKKLAKYRSSLEYVFILVPNLREEELDSQELFL